MPVHLDEKMLTGFVQEAQSYLPEIQEGLAQYHRDPTQRQGLEDAARHVHTIKGAAAMVGFTTLSQLAAVLEELLDEVVDGQRPLDTAHATWFRDTVAQLAQYLTGLRAGDGSEQAIAVAIAQSVHQFTGRPPAITAAPVLDVAPGGDVETPALVPDTAPDMEPLFTEAGGPLETLIASIDATVRDVYRPRADAVAPLQLPAASSPTAERYLLFTLAGGRYAVAVPSILEIGRIPPITPVPNVPPWIRGVINLRGDILSVIDIRVFLGLEALPQIETSRLLVVQLAQEDLTTSLVVDQILGITLLPDTPMTLSSSLYTDRIMPYISEVYEHHAQVLAVFDLERFLRTPEIRQFD